MKSIKIVCFLIFVAISGNCFAAGHFEEKLKTINKSWKGKSARVLSAEDKKEISDYLRVNENVEVKQFAIMRLAVGSADVLIKSLNETYKTSEANFRKDITDKLDKKTYEIALKIIIKRVQKRYYACNPDEDKRKKMIKRDEDIRKSISFIWKKGRGHRTSDEIIKLYKENISLCKYGYPNYSLLRIYRKKSEVNEYNKLMLQILRDDQVGYDYMHNSRSDLDEEFILNYRFFLLNINDRSSAYNFSADEVEEIATNILDKHYLVFDVSNSFYFNSETKTFNEHRVGDAIDSLINVSIWLRHYKIDKLNKKFIDKFFTSGPIYEALFMADGRKDFKEYLENEKSK